ncbi:MAG: hypothetical protein R8M46_02810 [Ghiorsea sp.]
MNKISLLKPMVFPAIELSNQCYMPAFTLHSGEVMQLVAPEDVQEELIAAWLIEQDGKQSRMQGLGKQVGFVLNGLGLVANLTIKENIMLPLLYHKTKQTDVAKTKLAALVEEIEIKDMMEEQAGLRSARVNSEVSLCRCVLQQAAYIIMQQPQSCMSKTEAKQFTERMLKVVRDLRAGVVYLTASGNDCGGLTANHQVNLKLQEKVS